MPIRHVLAVCALLVFTGGAAAAPRDGIFTTTTHVDGRAVRYVSIPLAAVRIKVALAQGRAGRVESLDAIAHRYGALAAINGGDYDAYGTRTFRNANHTLISGGVFAFKGDVGDVLWFDENNNARIDRFPLRIAGSLDGEWTWPNNWYAYWINRAPVGDADTVSIFTPDWGERTGLEGATQIQVSRGVVTAIAHESIAIPPDGYVIYVRGERAMLSHFAVGRRVAFRIDRADGLPMGAFAGAREAIGCGPRLVSDGLVTVDPAAEGFRDPKILVASAERSAVGITADGRMLFVATSGTIRELAAVMRDLGARDAMAFDGGASTGIWYRGTALVKPGRLINNALLVTAR
ncbi:MAG TPA: phosphodiester glycosidase family protein [Candidatus Elarobacter sp.]|jgi:hypothetical protein